MIGFRGHTLSIILLGALSLASGFLPQCPSKLPLCSPTSIPFHTSVLALSTKSNVAEKDPVWIEKSSSMDETEEEDSNKEVDSYDVGISGEVFQTGKLGKRMFDAIVERMSMGMSDEIKKGFTLYAMDMTAKEATRAALQQNGLDMALEEEEEDQGMWGDVESVRLYDEKTGIAFSTLYDSLESALKDWSPGQPFDFVARKVPAKERELSVDELLEALDPDGKLREEAKGAKGEDFTPDEAALWEIFDGGLTSLADLADLNIRRTENSPRGATLEGEAFAGLDKRGYNVIRRSDLLLDSLNADGTENHKTLMHVMDAFVSHGVLLVDLTDGGSSFKDAEAMSKMWKAAKGFFKKIEDESVADTLPSMTTVMETGSQHARVGYASADNGSMKFFETRRERQTGALLPSESQNFLGEKDISAMQSAFDIVASVGKDAVRIATAASSVEHGAFLGDNEDEVAQQIRATRAAILLANELMDDGKPLGPTAEIEHNEGAVSMSPHRLCSYSDENEGTNPAREVFGAHVDSSFVTVVPVAAVSGLEVYDEAAEKWYRPELKARSHWEQEQSSIGKDPSALVEKTKEGVEIPWHARYIAVMAGEHMQLATRDEISATVHRVVAAKGRPARLSAPILLRARPGTKFLAKRYLGGTLGDPLLEECDDMTMEEIYDATQPTTKK